VAGVYVCMCVCIVSYVVCIVSYVCVVSMGKALVAGVFVCVLCVHLSLYVTYVRTYIYIHIHTYLDIHTYMHQGLHAHAYIHTYIRILQREDGMGGLVRT
jgi:hypothetical protein